MTPNFSSILKIMVPKRLKDQGLSKKKFFFWVGPKGVKKAKISRFWVKKTHIFKFWAN